MPINCTIIYTELLLKQRREVRWHPLHKCRGWTNLITITRVEVKSQVIHTFYKSNHQLFQVISSVSCKFTRFGDSTAVWRIGIYFSEIRTNSNFATRKWAVENTESCVVWQWSLKASGKSVQEFQVESQVESSLQLNSDSSPSHMTRAPTYAYCDSKN